MEIVEVGIQNKQEIELVHCPIGDLLLAPSVDTETSTDLKIIFDQTTHDQLRQFANSAVITNPEGKSKYFIKERLTESSDIDKYKKNGDTKFGFLSKDSLYAGASIMSEIRMAEKSRMSWGNQAPKSGLKVWGLEELA